MEKWKEEFEKKFKLTSQDVEWFGDGHFCSHHPDDQAHTEKCYIHPILKDIKAFISSLLQEQRQRIAKEIDELKNTCPKHKEMDSYCQICFGSKFFNEGAKAAQNIVLGEDNN